MKAGRVMHCDISANNVRLWRPPTGRVRGMLIDLEKSCILDEDGFVDEILMVRRSKRSIVDYQLTHPQGTVVFMSLNVLEGKLRTPADDLESLVYLLIYISHTGHLPLSFQLFRFIRNYVRHLFPCLHRPPTRNNDTTIRTARSSTDNLP